MEQKPPKLMTPFDYTTTPDWLYMIKLILPYTPEKLQHTLAVFIRFQEMQHTLKHFHGFHQTECSESILSALKPYMDSSTQEMMEQMESMMSMMEMMNHMQENDSMNMFADLFNMKGENHNE